MGVSLLSYHSRFWYSYRELYLAMISITALDSYDIGHTLMGVSILHATALLIGCFFSVDIPIAQTDWQTNGLRNDPNKGVTKINFLNKKRLTPNHKNPK